MSENVQNQEELQEEILEAQEQISVESTGPLTSLPGYDGLSEPEQEQIRQIESLASSDPNFLNSKEYQDLVSGLSGAQAQESEEEYEEEYQEEREEGAILTREEEDKVFELVELAEKDEEFKNSKEFQDLLTELEEIGYLDDEDDYEEEDDVFGVMKTSKKDKKINVNFEAPEEMIQLISSKFGVEDPSTFFESAEKWRNQAQEGSKVSEEYDRLKDDLQTLPFEIKQAIQYWANGDNYLEAFDGSERLDYSLDFNKQEPENLVQHYLSEQYDNLVSKYNSDKISDEEFEERIELLAGSTKRMFNDDRKALEKEREEFAESQRREYESFKKSALLSVENLGKTYPDFSKSEISKIRNILVEGKIDSLFMNNDGSYSDSAAEMVAYAMYGKKMLDSVKKMAQRQGESKANKRIVDSSPKTLRQVKSSGQNRGAGMKETQHLSGLFKNDPYA